MDETLDFKGISFFKMPYKHQGYGLVINEVVWESKISGLNLSKDKKY